MSIDRHDIARAGAVVESLKRRRCEARAKRLAWFCKAELVADFRVSRLQPTTLGCEILFLCKLSEGSKLHEIVKDLQLADATL